jgi:type IV secretion system protein VirB2
MKTTLNFMKKNASLVMFAMMLSLIFIEPSFAWGDVVDDFAGKVIAGLKIFGVSVITIAFMFAGYQIAFGGKSITSLMPIIIGALVVGTAALLAGLLINGK